jgi:hypothetical protein
LITRRTAGNKTDGTSFRTANKKQMAGLIEHSMPHAFPVREGRRIQELIGHQAAIAGLPCDHMDVGYGFQISVLAPADGHKIGGGCGLHVLSSDF